MRCGMMLMLIAAVAICLIPLMAEEAEAEDIGTLDLSINSSQPNTSSPDRTYSAIVGSFFAPGVHRGEVVYVTIGTTFDVSVTDETYVLGDLLPGLTFNSDSTPRRITGTVTGEGSFHVWDNSRESVCFTTGNTPDPGPTGISWSGNQSTYQIGDDILIYAYTTPAMTQNTIITVASGGDHIEIKGGSIGMGGDPFEATAVSAGTVTLRAFCTDDMDLSDEITFTIEGDVEPTGISWSGNQSTYQVGDEIEISAVVTPSTVSDTRTMITIRSGGELLDVGGELLDVFSIGMAGTPFEATALAPGTVTLRAISTLDTSFYDDITFTIEGDEYEYILNFSGNGLGTGVPAALSYTGPETSHTFTIPSIVPSADGYVFKGWSLDSRSDVAAYQPGGTITLQSTQPSDWLYAVWEEAEPTGISWSGNQSTYQVGDEIEISAVVTPSTVSDTRTMITIRSGGELLDVDTRTMITIRSGGELLDVFSIGMAGTPFEATALAPGTVTLRAISTLDNSLYDDITFTIEGDEYEYILNFSGNGLAEAPDPLTYTGPETSHTFTIPSTILYSTGYVFKGWSLDSRSDVAAYQPGGTITLQSTQPSDWLYAVWEEDEYTGITWSGNQSTYLIGDYIEISAEATSQSGMLDPGTYITLVSGSEYVDPVGIGMAGIPWRGDAIAPGTVTLRAVSVGDETLTSEISFTIIGGGTSPSGTSVNLTGSMTAMVGETRTITAVVLPTDLTDRTVTWDVTEGSDLIEYTTTDTYRGGELTYTATGEGTLTITATAVEDDEAIASITIIISGAEEEHSDVISIGGLVQAIADTLFSGSATVAGVVLFAIVLAVLFAIIRQPLPVVLLGIPVMGVFTLLGLLDMDMVILLIIVTAVGLALIARNMWRD